MASKRRRQSKTRPVEVPFKAGDGVRAKAGVKDPDLQTPIGGWQGRVILVEEDMVDIAWDSLTLQVMPARMIDWCEEQGLDWAEMRLSADEVEPAEPRDSAAAAAHAKKTLTEQHAWAFLGEEGRRIQKVLVGIDPEDDWKAMKVWHRHLKKALTFPFEAVVAEHGGPFRPGEKVLVIGLNAHVDDKYSVIADLGGRHAGYAYPLCDLEVQGKSPNRQQVSDYAVWFANR